MPFQIVESGTENESESASAKIIEIPSHVAVAGDALIDAQPDVSEHAIAQHDEQVKEAAATVERDKNGIAFDATIHTGSRLKDGTWRVRRSAKGLASKVAKPAGSVDAANEAQSRAAGAAAAGALFMLGRAFGGEEWAPTAEEVKMQSDAWSNYFVAKNVRDFPPGIALVIAVGSYAGPRLAMPKTREKMGRAKSWFTLRAIKWRVTRELKRRGIAATVVIRDGDLFINGQQYQHWIAARERPIEPVKKP